MQIENLKSQNLLLLECVTGSTAYGLALPHSDVDVKGVFILPEEVFFGLHYTEQVSNPSNDITYYELSKCFDLLLKNNPSLLELIATPEEHVTYRHPLFEQVKPEMFLSKLCKNTFAGYADNQIKRARGLNKKISNPMSEERKGILDFCYVAVGQGAVPVQKWLAEHGWRQEYCGLANIPHMGGLYGLFYDEKAHRTEGREGLGFSGIARKETSNEVSLSSIPKGMQPVALMSFNKDGYAKYCKDYREYFDWVQKRNDERYKMTVSHGKNYDSKNMMHTFRLLAIAEEIATERRVNVKRPDREFLLKVRAGEYAYDDLLQMAEEKVRRIEELYAASDLPDEPDEAKVEELLVEIRRGYYSYKNLTGF